MVRTLQFDRQAAKGRYCDIMDVADALSELHGNASNAAAHMIRASRLYQKTAKRLGITRDEPGGKVRRPKCPAV